MSDSLGGRLLGRARSLFAPREDYPAVHPPPTADELRTARENLYRGGPKGAETFLELLVSADGRGGELRTKALSEIMKSSPEGWLALDLASRRRWWAFPPWWRAAVDQAAHGQSVLGVLVASFHPDGRVREAATARLAELDHMAVRPALAIRCGDWVAQVRDRARLDFDRFLEQDRVGTLESAGAVALLVSRRQSGTWLATTVDQHLRSAPTSEIRTLAGSSHALARRRVLAIAVDQKRFDADELVDLAAREGDLPARLICGQAAIALADHSRNVDVLQRLLDNPAVQLRQAALVALDKAGEADAAEALLADRARSVRDTAQRLIRARGGDPAQAYREVIAEGSPPVWAIGGIGETGSSTDAVLVEPLLDDVRAGVRAEAVRALRRLDLVEPDRIAPLLSDPSPPVCKQATIALMPLARQLDMERLRGLLRSQGPSHTRVAAYRLLRARSAWTRLQTNLELLDDESAEFRTRARADILGWIADEAASTYQRPDPEMADELARAIDDRAAVLGPSAVEALRFHAGLTAQ